MAVWSKAKLRIVLHRSEHRCLYVRSSKGGLFHAASAESSLPSLGDKESITR